MKKLNFLSKLCRLARASQYCDVGIDRRLTVGSPSESHRLSLYIAVMFLLLVVGVGNAWGTDVTLKFGANQGEGYVTTTSGNIDDNLAYSTFKGSSETTAPTVYDDGLRLYHKNNANTEGGVLRIYVRAGQSCTINSVEVTFTTGKLGYIASAHTYGESLSSITKYNAGDSPVTISDIDATSIHLSNANSNTTQTRIQQVDISYSCEGDDEVCTAGNASSIKAGDVVLIYYPSGSKEFGGFTSASDSYFGSSHAYTTTPDGYFPFTVEAGSASGYWSFKNGTNYLAMSASGNNKLVGSATKNDASSWSVSINGSTKEATITNKSYDGYIIKYNTSSPRFSSYTPSASSTALPKIYRYCDDIEYYVTYDGNGNTSGSVPTDATGYASGTTVTVKGNTGSLAKTGYDFGGWNTNAAGTGTNYTAGSGTFSITGSITLYAKWTAKTINLTLDKNNNDASGSSNGSGSIKYDATTKTSITAATRTGYAVEGYYSENTCAVANKVLTASGDVVNSTVSGYTTSGKWTRTTTPTTLYTKWTIQSYTLTWNLNGGTVTVAGTGAAVNATGSPSISVAYGTAITVPTVTKEGNTFTGWSATPASTMPASNTTYTAQWTPNVYTVTWKVNNTDYSAGGSSSVTHGTHISTLPTAPNPPTYGCGDKFVGWTTVQNYVHGTSPLYTTASEFPTATDDQVFYAVYADYAD